MCHCLDSELSEIYSKILLVNRINFMLFFKGLTTVDFWGLLKYECYLRDCRKTFLRERLLFVYMIFITIHRFIFLFFILPAWEHSYILFSWLCPTAKLAEPNFILPQIHDQSLRFFKYYGLFSTASTGYSP